MAKLALTQELLLEVLAARTRLGEPCWTFPSQARPQLRALQSAGLVQILRGHDTGDVVATLSDDGRHRQLPQDYQTPTQRMQERLEQERAATAQVWAMLREEQQTSRALRDRLTRLESEAAAGTST